MCHSCGEVQCCNCTCSEGEDRNGDYAQYGSFCRFLQDQFDEINRRLGNLESRVDKIEKHVKFTEKYIF